MHGVIVYLVVEENKGGAKECPHILSSNVVSQLKEEEDRIVMSGKAGAVSLPVSWCGNLPSSMGICPPPPGLCLLQG